MKFMKLGSKPDAFQADGKFTRYVVSDLTSDVVINVGEVKFRLHKFPLLSKSVRLQKLIPKHNEENSDEIFMTDFPGGHKAFEICAKFCYGMTVTLNAYNVVAARCAAEYLEMTEDIDRGNLVYKIEVFLNSSIFHSWKDSIIVLKTTKSLLPWSEDLKIVGRSIDSIASKTSVDPSNVTWSYTHNRKLSAPDMIVEEESILSVPTDWWVEDVSELDIDTYKRVMTAVKSKGRMDADVIGEALKTYAARWLPDSVESLLSDTNSSRNKLLVETIVFLFASDNGLGCSCSFLLKLLKVAVLIRINDSTRQELVNNISFKLDQASVKDLLIPERSRSHLPQTTLYDVELIKCIVKQYLLNQRRDLEMESEDLVLGNASLLSVGKLIDGFLQEIARDTSLDLGSFIDMARSVPEAARPVHDGLYKAIDLYMKEHPNLTKSEKKKVCALMDVKKLSTEASNHAAQNEQLPLRVIVQVLYFEQIRAAALNTTTTDDELEKTASATGNEDSSSSQDNNVKKMRSKNSKSAIQLLPSRSRKLFDLLRIGGKGQMENNNNKSSETSGSSHSPTASVVPGDGKSSGSSSRNRRHSIS